MLTALSFDDGFLAHVNIAQLLARLGIRATFFCITHLKTFGGALIATHPEYIKEIADLGHEIGSHTCTHKHLVKLPRDRLDYELKASKLLLEDILGREVLGMAYPYGCFNARVLSATAKYYQYARSVAVYRLIEDSYNIRPPSRYTISALKIRHLPKLLIKRFEYGTLHPVLYAHNVHISEMVAIILYLRALGADFVTVSELVDYLTRKGLLCNSR